MRLPIIMAALAGTLGAMAAQPAAAYHDQPRYRTYSYAGDARAYRYARKYRYLRRYESHDQVRANDLDPAGDYKAYPAWARAALSPKFDGGGRFR